MRSVSYRLADLNHVTVPLGFRGENEHTRVIIDCKKAFDEYPTAIPSLAVSPPNGAAYPVVIVRDGDLVYWDVRDSDLAKEGRGTAQLTFTEDGVVRKDDIFKTVIGKSILPAGPAPDPIADWITEANKAIGTIEGALETAQEAAEDASGSAAAASGSAADAANQATAAAESAEAARSAAGEAAQKADDAVESARASASSATAAAGSANSAAGSATQAAGSAEAAAGLAVEAGTSAAAAAGSATAAAESATNAAEAEANASEQATAAAASEANAADSATAAATSETNAANSETNAAASATAAAGSASDAADSATAASGSATAAEGSANAAAASAASAASAAEALIDDTSTATNKTWSAKKISTAVDALQKDKAPVIIDSAVGNPIVLTDGADGLPVEGMKIHFLPVQDLHGYDSPWPAGGGKNLFDPQSTEQYWVAVDGSYNIGANAKSVTLSVSPGDTFTMSSSNARTTTNILCLAYYDENDANLSRNIPATGGFSVTATAPTGAVKLIASCYTYSEAGNVQLEKNSSATSFAPYSNICPISGWEGVTAWRTGKNMLAPVLYKGVSYNPPVGTVFNTELHAKQFTDNHDGTFTLTTSSSWQYYCLLFPVHHKKRCYANIQCSSSGSLGRTTGYLDKDLKVLTATNLTTTSWTYSVYLNPESTDNAEYWYMVISNRSSASATITVTNPQIEYSSSESEYEPYQGNSYPITFPDGQTLYGGTLDAVNGVLSVEWAIVDMGAIKWTYHNSGFLYNSTLPIKQDGYGTICSIYPKGDSSIPKRIFVVGYILRVYDPDYTDPTVFKSAVSGQTICFPLATPIEIPLDPITVQTLIGDNTIWTDTNGENTIRYKKKG